MRFAPIIFAALGAILAGLVAIRATEVQPAVLVIALFCMPLGFVRPRFAWLSAIIVGGGVFLAYWICQLAHIPVVGEPEMSGHPSIFGSLIAIAPALVTAYVGAVTRWIAGPGISAKSTSA